jgi:hypothetical protein
VARLAAHDGSIPLIPLAVPQVRRLVYRLMVRAPPEAVLHRSRWRRLHQARAVRSRYRRRRRARHVLP